MHHHARPNVTPPGLSRRRSLGPRRVDCPKEVDKDVAESLIEGNVARRTDAGLEPLGIGPIAYIGDQPSLREGIIILGQGRPDGALGVIQTQRSVLEIASRRLPRDVL